MSNLSEKKKALIAQKQRLIQEIKQYESEIEEVRCNGNKSLFLDEDSSDSDTEVWIQTKTCASEMELKKQRLMLKTCLQATQELTSLEILQSEVNLLVEDPKIIGEQPITEEGVWREVTAECCIDLVPFSITFYTHKPNRKFSQLSYRGLRVVPVKTAHEAELARSVLPGLLRPSDACEVVRSYAEAHRSRRSTLASLASKFNDALFMEPMPEGGYKLRCASLMEVSWTLQNKFSPIAPFHHRMKFDLEYMDESYVKTIKQVHRQLSDPSVDTPERTRILSKIICTCLEAQGPTQELYESMSSDHEAAKLKTRRTTLDNEPEIPHMRVRNDAEMVNKDKEVMAPPKSLPRKGKNKVKRSVSDAGDGKKLKNVENNANNESNMRKNQVDVGNNDVIETEMVNKGTEVVAPQKKVKNKVKRSVSDAGNGKRLKLDENNANNDTNMRKNLVDVEKNDIEVEETVANVKNSKGGNTKNVNKKTEESNAIGKASRNIDKIITKDGVENVGNVASVKKGSVKRKNEERLENDVASAKMSKASGNTEMNEIAIVANAKNESVKTQKVKRKMADNVEKVIAGAKLSKISEKNERKTDTEAQSNLATAKISKDAEKGRMKNIDVEKNVANAKNGKASGNLVNVKNNNDVEIEKKANSGKIVKKNIPIKVKNADQKANTVPKKNSENTESGKENFPKTIVGKKVVKKTDSNSARRDDDTKSVATSKNALESNRRVETNKPGNIIKEKHNTDVKEKGQVKKIVTNIAKNSEKVKMVANVKNSEPKIVKTNDNSANKIEEATEITNIPIKKDNKKDEPKTIKQTINKNPIRISPRKLVTKSKMSPKFLTNSQKTIQKPVTGIPRLMAKPKPKIK